MWNSIQVLPNQVIKKSFYTFEDIDLRESHAKLHKNRVKLWEQIENYLSLYNFQIAHTKTTSVSLFMRYVDILSACRLFRCNV